MRKLCCQAESDARGQRDAETIFVHYISVRYVPRAIFRSHAVFSSSCRLFSLQPSIPPFTDSTSSCLHVLVPTNSRTVFASANTVDSITISCTVRPAASIFLRFGWTGMYRADLTEHESRHNRLDLGRGLPQLVPVIAHRRQHLLRVTPYLRTLRQMSHRMFECHNHIPIMPPSQESRCALYAVLMSRQRSWMRT